VWALTELMLGNRATINSISADTLFDNG